jgi:ABC-type transport system substrate-binding protein
MTPTTQYAAVADVQATLGNIGAPGGFTIGSGTTPNTTTVEGWLDQVAGEIDAILTARGYGTVPATGTSDMAMIKRYLAQKVAAMVYHSHAVFDVTPEMVKTWETEYSQFCDRLISKAMSLVDQNPRSRVGTLMAQRYTTED